MASFLAAGWNNEQISKQRENLWFPLRKHPKKLLQDTSASPVGSTRVHGHPPSYKEDGEFSLYSKKSCSQLKFLSLRKKGRIDIGQVTSLHALVPIPTCLLRVLTPAVGIPSLPLFLNFCSPVASVIKCADLNLPPTWPYAAFYLFSIFFLFRVIILALPFHISTCYNLASWVITAMKLGLLSLWDTF